MQNKASRVSLGAVHTHTHTHTFREIRRVANKATLFGIENRLFVALYKEKNKVLEIACFLRCRKSNLIREFYTNLKINNQYKEAKVGGVE